MAKDARHQKVGPLIEVLALHPGKPWLSYSLNFP
jgi:hypothetical protein